MTTRDVKSRIEKLSKEGFEMITLIGNPEDTFSKMKQKYGIGVLYTSLEESNKPWHFPDNGSEVIVAKTSGEDFKKEPFKSGLVQFAKKFNIDYKDLKIEIHAITHPDIPYTTYCALPSRDYSNLHHQ